VSVGAVILIALSVQTGAYVAYVAYVAWILWVLSRERP
jgi:hypothetical protein